MKSLKKQGLTQVLQVGIYKDFSLSTFLGLIVFWIVLFLIISGAKWIGYKRDDLPMSPLQSIIAGAVAGFLFHLPSFLSAMVMNLMRKPMLRFDKQGFYYTPQIWSRSELYEWEKVKRIKVKRKRDNDDNCLITIYLSDDRCVVINESIIPLYYNQLLQIFRLRLKNVPIIVQ